MIDRAAGEQNRIRYGVVGLGHIAQAAVLTAFRHAAENSELGALISGDAQKRRRLGKRYTVRFVGDYGDYDRLLHSGEIDAVYLALPNHLHCEYAVRAAEAGVHVLCEKPMAITEEECEQMIAAAERGSVKLMIAYRLHFDPATLEAIDLVRSGRIGEPRYFTSSFSMQVRPDNIRVHRELGGGPLYDIGIYCINAARSLFQAEPELVQCLVARGDDSRFREVEEMAAVTLRFPRDRLATFVCSFGAADVSSYRIVGTRGDLLVEPAYEYQAKLAHRLTINGKSRRQSFPRSDQFAPELMHFSECIQIDRDPVPSGLAGLADIRCIEALHRSAREQRAVAIEPVDVPCRPSPEFEMHRPPVSKPRLVNAESASQ